MSVRTVQRWVAAEHAGKSSRVGRPAFDAELRRRARRDVARAMRELRGLASWRSVQRWLEGRVPSSLVKSLCCALKRRLHGLRDARIRALRQHVHVEVPCVLGSLDSTYLGQDLEGGKVWARHLLDVATRESTAIEVGPEPCGEDLVELLEKVRCERGLPLVLALDNGGAEKSETLARFLAEHQVIALHNVPRTPQHNAWIERAHAELQRGLGLNKKVHVLHQPLSAWREEAECVRRLLNEALPRVCLGGRTSVEARQEAPAPYDRDTRARFYAATCAALKGALADLTALRASHPARRKAEREAIWMSMEAFGLIERTRGEAARRGAKCDSFS